MKGTLTPTYRVRVPFMSFGIEARLPSSSARNRTPGKPLHRATGAAGRAACRASRVTGPPALPGEPRYRASRVTGPPALPGEPVPGKPRYRASYAGPTSSVTGQAELPGELADLFHDLVGDVKVGVDVLDVIGIFERIDQPEDSARSVLVNTHSDSRHEARLC